MLQRGGEPPKIDRLHDPAFAGCSVLRKNRSLTQAERAIEQANKLQCESLQNAAFSVTLSGSQLSAGRTTERIKLHQQRDPEAVNGYAYSRTM
jgi:hypothetical protein